MSEEFSVENGLRQGDALSPMLFNIALQYVVRAVIEFNTGIKIQENTEATIMAYADDIMIVTESEANLKKTTADLIEKSKDMGLVINEIGQMRFERVETFKYLGVGLDTTNGGHNEVQRRITAANRCFRMLRTLFKSRILSKKSKITMYKVLVRPIALYACKVWPSTKIDEKKLVIFERKVLRQIFGPKMKEESKEFERRTNDDLYELYNQPDIVTVMKSKRIGWAGHVWRAEGKIINKITSWKLNKKRPLGRPRQRWSDRVYQDLRLIGVDNPEEMAKDRERWEEVVVAAKGLNGLY
ncbi:hypothetical protein QTP88_021422 [Uroleucon formosanum]